MFEILSGVQHWATDILLSFGYVGIAGLMALETVVPPIPSEVILPLAGFQVAEANLVFPLVVLAATVGSLAGSLILYGCGVWFGPLRLRRFVARRGRYLLIDVRDLERAQRWFDTHEVAAVLIGRMVPGMRSLISLPAGLARMSLWRFTLYTALGGALWNSLLVSLGWMLKDRWGMVGSYAPIVEFSVLFALVVCVLWFVVQRGMHRTLGTSRTGTSHK